MRERAGGSGWQKKQKEEEKRGWRAGKLFRGSHGWEKRGFSSGRAHVWPRPPTTTTTSTATTAKSYRKVSLPWEAWIVELFPVLPPGKLLVELSRVGNRKHACANQTSREWQGSGIPSGRDKERDGKPVEFRGQDGRAGRNIGNRWGKTSALLLEDRGCEHAVLEELARFSKGTYWFSFKNLSMNPSFFSVFKDCLILKEIVRWMYVWNVGCFKNGIAFVTTYRVNFMVDLMGLGGKFRYNGNWC